jgi:hypothetical protein
VLRRSERADMFTPVTNVRIRDAVLFMHVTPIVRNPVVTYPVAHLVAHLVARLPTAVCVAERKPPRSKRRQLVIHSRMEGGLRFRQGRRRRTSPKSTGSPATIHNA